ncbi:membrane protein involved in the export of O-antigen and teichoic acid [Halorubrum aidingense JCM 13560]|uniref:Membrane protein involved in the export of O-antigen and teichoic acid n=1 Tax=Halorubrum aidingense JCM 13560 TaxID=1230454 RepID=M0P9Y2_9EURY|nr:flippase [Halorubrum aidingense]EMA66952.1 membrane protein involved in the export of O-antigen and teichoic acid [Halorubrum aidingense JCM 13560]
MNLARASSLLFGVELLNTALGFFGTVYFARELGATLLGIFFLFEATLYTMATVVDFGLRGAVEKRISAGDDPAQMFGAAVVLKVLLIFVVSVFVLAVREPLAGYVGTDLAVELIGVVIAFELSMLVIHVLQGELRVAQTAVLHFLRSLTFVTVAVGLLQYGYGVRALVYALLVSYTVLLVGGILRVSTPVARPGRRHLRSLYDYAKFNGIWGLGGHVYNWMDVIVIGFFLSQAAVGAYELAWRLTTTAIMFSTVFARVLFPQLSAWQADGAVEKVRDLISEAMTVSLLLIVPSVVGVTVIGREILGVIFGLEYTIAAAAFLVLMIEKLPQAVNLVFDKAIQAFDRPKYGAIATVVSLSMNITLNVLLVPRYGLVGAAAATLLSVIANTAILGYYLGRLTTIRFPVRDVGWTVLAAVGMGLGLVGLTQILTVDTPQALLAAIGGSAILYGAGVLAAPPLRAKIIENVRNVPG